MTTLQEIRTAIAHLDRDEKFLLMAELFADQPSTPDEAELEAALAHGLQDVQAGRVRPLEDARALITQWTTES